MDFFSIRQFSYKSVIIFSMLLFFASYLLDIRNQPAESEMLYIAGYTSAILLAAFWTFINYIDHLRINPLYKAHTSIDSYTNDLQLSKDEKLEIRQMMLDYVADQKSNGREESEAALEIIQQFKTEELQSTGSQLFYFHKHKYLLGIGGLLLLIGALAWLIVSYNASFHTPFFIVLEVTAICYGLGLCLTFLMYHVLNRILISK